MKQFVSEACHKLIVCDKVVPCNSALTAFAYVKIGTFCGMRDRLKNNLRTSFVLRVYIEILCTLLQEVYT